jgi:integrase
MGHVYKPTATKPIPRGATIRQRRGGQVAEWTDRHGRKRSAPVTATAKGNRISIESRVYVARYRDADGFVRIVSTKCRDEQAARSVLLEWEKRVQRRRSGVLTAADDVAAQHLGRSIEEHLGEYLVALKAKGDAPRTLRDVERLGKALFREAGVRVLRDLTREAIERWIVGSTNAKRGARTRNTYFEVGVAFANWCVATGRLLSNPLAAIPAADEKADRKRQPRALTLDEVERLLDAAQRRPLAEALLVRRGTHKGKLRAKVRPEVRTELVRIGYERALVYRTLVLTGLRVGELRELTIARVRLAGVGVPHLELDARHEKNREGSTVALHPALAADLRVWIEQKRQRAPKGLYGKLPEGWAAATPLFDVPEQLSKIMDRDIAFAKIDKRDDRGRVVHVHALRHTFGTYLGAAGVGVRTAQAAMRHSSPELTANVYTDARLLDVAGAVSALPALPLADLDAVAATGTDGLCSSLWREQSNPDESGHLQSGGGAGVPRKNPIRRACRADDRRTRQDSNLQPSVPKTDALSN